MAESHELFKNFEEDTDNSEKKVHKKHTQGGDKMSHKEIHIRLKVPKIKPIVIERLIYWLIIIALIIMVFVNPFGKTAGDNQTNTTGVVVSDADEDSAPDDDATDSGDEDTTDSGDETTDNEDNGDTTDDSGDDDTTDTEDTTDDEDELSGEVLFAIGDIELDEDKKRVESISISIDNQYKLFSPILRIYMYDPDSIDSFKTTYSEVKLPLLIAGKDTTKTIERSDLDFSYLRVDDEDKETFKVELYDGNTLLDTKTKIISTS